MEKRFIAFIAASVVIMGGFMLLQTFFGPKPKPDKPIPLAEKKVDPKKDDKKPDPKVVKNGDTPEAAKPKKPEAPKIPQQWTTLGSIDESSPYRMLVTFTNQGAAIERIELASELYLDLEDWKGYLGHLALTRAEKRGCQVNVVGSGTPAALATAAGVSPGLLPGDIIHMLDGQETDSPEELEELLRKTKPKQTVDLSVTRETEGKLTPLTFKVDLIHRPLEMVRPEFGSSADPDEQHPLSLLLTLQSIGPGAAEETNEGGVKIKRGEREIEGLPSLLDGRWQMKPLTGEVPGVEFRYLLDEDALKNIGQSGKIEVVKRYRLAETPPDKHDVASFKSYHLEFDLEINNLGPDPQQVAYRLGGTNGLPLEGWWYQNKIHPHFFVGAGARDVIWSTKKLTHGLMGCPRIYDDATAKAPKPTMLFASSDLAESRQLNYAGVDAQYFTTALIPYDFHAQSGVAYEYQSAEALPALIKKDKSGRKIANTTFRLISTPGTIAPNESLKHSFILFAGPKEPYLLSEYNLDRAIEYGWFRWIASALSWILHSFHSLTGNYGIAIIMLTVLVRGCMLPIGLKMAKNMQAMQDLSPEIKIIKEKYKDDLAKQGKAQQELMRKHGVNPYAGCLPLFLQMPIFLGLYRALSVDIALRQAALVPGIFWCSNLAGPDMLWRWDKLLPDMLAGESGYLGPYLNVFPLVTAGLFLVQQKLFTPPPTDEQQEMQQKIMKFMTIFMSVMFFKVPAGLCLYFITSSLWGIAERTMMKPKKKPGEAVAAKPSPKKLPDKSGSNGAKKDDLKAKQNIE